MTAPNGYPTAHRLPTRTDGDVPYRSKVDGFYASTLCPLCGGLACAEMNPATTMGCSLDTSENPRSTSTQRERWTAPATGFSSARCGHDMISTHPPVFCLLKQ